MLIGIKDSISYIIPSIKYFIYAIPLYSIWFLSYLELSPKLGNIWYRFASDGKKHINLGGLIEFIYKPFKHSFFWWPKFWDINVYMGIYITAVLINLLHKAYTSNR